MFLKGGPEVLQKKQIVIVVNITVNLPRIFFKAGDR